MGEENTGAVYHAIVAVQGEIAKAGISKDRTNQQHSYKFRGVDDIYNALAPLLARHDLCIIPRMVERTVDERKAASGKALFFVTVIMEYDLVCPKDGSTHTARMCGEAMDSGDKATNKAMSAAYKYFCFQTFCIPTEGEDNDPDANTPEEVEPKEKTKNFKFIKAVAEQKARVGDAEYYRVLKGLGYDHANEILPHETQTQFYNKLRDLSDQATKKKEEGQDVGK